MPYRRKSRRRGKVLVMIAILMPVLLGLGAFAIDIGNIELMQSQVQVGAESSALAVVEDMPEDQAELDELVQRYAQHNVPGNHSLQITATPGLWDSNAKTFTTTLLENANAVRVTVHRPNATLFFGKLLGKSRADVDGEATAAFMEGVRGFEVPPNGGNLGMLPLALDEETWDGLMNGVGQDNWTYDDGAITSGADGILEVNLYPQGTGAPGNRGTVDIGSNNNSTADLSRQILNGASPEDLEYHGGKLELDENGELALNGDTGISAGIKDELTQIKGKGRIIPVFRTVTGNGNNSTFTIVKFVGVRVMDVKLTGNMSGKRVMIQPADVVSHGGIPSTGTSTTSHHVYLPPMLVK